MFLRQQKSKKMDGPEGEIAQLRNQVEGLRKLNSVLKRDYEQISLSLDAAESELLVANDQLSRLLKGSSSIQQEMKKDLVELVAAGEQSLLAVSEENQRLRREVEALRAEDTTSLRAELQSALNRMQSDADRARRDVSEQADVIRMTKLDVERREAEHRKKEDEWKRGRADAERRRVEEVKRLMDLHAVQVRQAREEGKRDAEREAEAGLKRLMDSHAVQVRQAREDGKRDAEREAEAGLKRLMDSHAVQVRQAREEGKRDAEREAEAGLKRLMDSHAVQVRQAREDGKRDMEAKMDQLQREQEARVAALQAKFEMSERESMERIASSVRREEEAKWRALEDSNLAKVAARERELLSRALREGEDAIARVRREEEVKVREAESLVAQLRRDLERAVANLRSEESARSDVLSQLKRENEQVAGLKRDLSEALARGEQLAGRVVALESEREAAKVRDANLLKQNDLAITNAVLAAKREVESKMERELQQLRAAKQEMEANARRDLVNAEASKRDMEVGMKRELSELIRQGEQLAVQLGHAESARQELAEMFSQRQREWEEHRRLSAHVVEELKKTIASEGHKHETELHRIKYEMGSELKQAMERGDLLAEKLASAEKQVQSLQQELSTIKDGESQRRMLHEQEMHQVRKQAEELALREQNEARSLQSTVQRLVLEVQEVRSTSSAQVRQLEMACRDHEETIRKLQGDLKRASDTMSEQQSVEALRLRNSTSVLERERQGAKVELERMGKLSVEREAAIRKLEQDLVDQSALSLQNLERVRAVAARDLDLQKSQSDAVLRKLQSEVQESAEKLRAQTSEVRRLQADVQEANRARLESAEAVQRMRSEIFEKEAGHRLVVRDHEEKIRRLERDLQGGGMGTPHAAKTLEVSRFDNAGSDHLKALLSDETRLREAAGNKAASAQRRLVEESGLREMLAERLEALAAESARNANAAKETIRSLETDLERARSRFAASSERCLKLEREVTQAISERDAARRDGEEFVRSMRQEKEELQDALRRAKLPVVDDRDLQNDQIEQIKAVQALEAAQRELLFVRKELEEAKMRPTQVVYEGGDLEAFEKELAQMQRDLENFEQLKAENAELHRSLLNLKRAQRENDSRLEAEGSRVKELQETVQEQKLEIARLKAERDVHSRNDQIRLTQAEEGAVVSGSEAMTWKSRFDEARLEAEAANHLKDQMQLALSEAQGRIRETQHRLEGLEQQIQSNEQQRAVQRKLDAVTLENGNLTASLANALQQVENLKLERREALSELDVVSKRADNLELDLKRAKQERRTLDEMRVRMEKMEIEVKDAQRLSEDRATTILQHDATIRRLSQESLTFRREKSALELELSSVCEVLEDEKRRGERTLREVASLQRENRGLTEALSLRVAEVRKIESELRTSLLEAQSGREEIEKLEAELRRMRSDAGRGSADLQRENQALTETLGLRVAEIEKLEAELRRMRSDAGRGSADLQRENQALTETLGLRVAEIEKLEAELRRMRSDAGRGSADLQRENQALTETLGLRVAEIEKLEAELRRMRSDAGRGSADLQRENQALTETLGLRLAEIEKLEAELRRVRSEVQNGRGQDEVANLQSELKSCLAETQSLRSLLDTRNSELDSSKLEREVLMGHISESSDAIAASLEQIERLEAELRTTQNESGEKSSLLKKLELEALSLKSGKAGLEMEIARLGEQVASLQSGNSLLQDELNKMEEKALNISDSDRGRVSGRVSSESKGQHDDNLVQTLISKEVQIHNLTSQLEALAKLSASQAKELDQLTSRLASMEAQSEVRKVTHYCCQFLSCLFRVCERCFCDGNA
jgi:chromosome segregation ATPase